MLTPFVLFFGLTVATAVIAYWSDNLGKKLGKKRISLFGMRPRTTATVLTVASSWGIMLFTLIVMLVVAKPLRDALFRFDRERAQNQELRAQRDQLILQKKDIEKTLGDQQERLNLVEKQAVRASRNVRIQTGNASRAQAAAKESQRQQLLAVKREAIARRGEKNAVASERMAKRGAAAATTRAVDARQGEMAAKAQASLASASLAQVQLQLNQNKERLREASVNLLQTNKELGVAQNRYKYAQQKLKAADAALSRVKKLIQTSNDYAQTAFAEAAEAEKEATNAKKEYQDARKEVNTLIKQREDLQRDISEQNTVLNQLSVLARRPVLVTFDQTLAARTLPRSLAPARIESHLRSLLRVAQENGERLLRSTDVKVELVQDVEIADGKKPVKIPDEQVYSSASDFIAASNREVSVRVVSLSNFAEGEPYIYVRFQMVEVKKAINAGDVLASRSIDSKIGDSAIFTSLLDLVEVGRREATRRGVNPPQSADDPNFYENGTNEQIFEALRKIEKIGGTPTVQIVATDDLSTVEPIRVRFEVS